MRKGHAECQAAADFAELLSATGCRLSEANQLRWQDVDPERERLLIHGAKGRATSSNSAIRYLPFTAPLAALLARLRKPESKPTDPICTVRECRGTMQRACVGLGLPRKLDHHDLRHAFATRAIARGIPIPIVSDWLGHKDGGALLLKTYRHEQPEVSREWAQKMNEDAPAIPVGGAGATGSQDHN